MLLLYYVSAKRFVEGCKQQNFQDFIQIVNTFQLREAVPKGIIHRNSLK